jgi:MscS family membrane protein
MEIMNEYLQYEFFGLPVIRYIIAAGVLFAAIIVRRIFDRYIGKKLLQWVEKTSFRYDDLLVRAIIPPINLLIILYGFIVATSIVELPIGDFLADALRVTLAVIVVWIAFRLCTPVTEILRDIMAKSDDALATQFVPILRTTLQIAVVLIGGIMILQNSGYEVSSLLAGLGIGGLAIALAAQETVSNIFGTLVMFTDKPFKIGDWVQFKDVDGDVESIGFRSTRVRTWAKSIQVIPNKMLTSEIIENWSVMPKRRVRMTIGVQYDSPPEKVEELTKRIYNMLQSHPQVNQEYMIVAFSDFGPSSLDIFIYYFTTVTAWKDYMHIRQAVNIEIMKTVEELGLSFAFPSQTVYFGDELRMGPANGSTRLEDPTLPK